MAETDNEAKTASKTAEGKGAMKADTSGPPTHIRFVGNASSDESSECVVFGKRFYRGKWVPLANLNGSNPDKKALDEGQFKKLLGNPAFEVGHGEDKPIPGNASDIEQVPAEEA